MTIRLKTLLISAITLTGLLAALYWGAKSVLWRNASKLEKEFLVCDLSRANDAVDQAKGMLQTFSYDWAAWDTTYEFVNSPSEGYINDNFTPETFEGLKTNLIAIVDVEGKLVAGNLHRIDDDGYKPVPPEILAWFAPDSELIQKSKAEGGYSGIIITRLGPMLVAANPILTSEGKGPSRGTLIFGQSLNGAFFENISRVTHLSVSAHAWRGFHQNATFDYAIQRLSPDHPTLIHENDDTTITGLSIMDDIDGNPALVLAIVSERQFLAHAAEALGYVLIWILFAGAVFGSVWLIMLTKLFLTPLAVLKSEVDFIAKKDDLSSRIKIRGHDELSIVGISINNMLERIDIADQKRRDAEKALSYRLLCEEGLAECSQILLDPNADNFGDALKHLLVASDANRAILWENFRDPNLGLCMRAVAEVTSCSDDANSYPTILQPIPYISGFNRWEEVLSEGDLIKGIVATLPQPERALLRSRDIRTVLALPLFVNGEWYGSIEFDNTTNEKEWDFETIRTLQTAAEIFGTYFSRKWAEDQLERQTKLLMFQNMELEAKSNQLKAQQQELIATNHELSVAKSSAESANRSKTEFLANISHEIRTPLNCIIGFADIILDGSKEPTVRDQANIIQRESEHLLSLINELLDHAKIEAGKLKLDRHPFDVQQVIEHVISVIQVRAKNKELELKINIDPSVPPFIYGDALRIRQTLLNLVGNAVKFTEHGWVKVSVDTVMDDDTQMLRFSITDTGIGIPKEKQANIFHSFTQADGSTTRRYGGTGLGTAICRSLVEMMGGQIGMESEEFEGSTFWFTMPLEKADSQDIEMPEVIEEIVNTTEDSGRVGKILVVEDYPTNRMVAAEYLAGTPHEVAFAENGVEAVETCNETKFDLIFMDVQMPEMDGYEATRQIRNGDSPNSKAPIIGLTAHADDVSHQSCLRAGMNSVETKPLRRDRLLATVRQWIFLEEEITPIDENALTNTQVITDGRVMNTNVQDTAPLDLETAVEEFGSETAIESILNQFLQNVEDQIAKLTEAVTEEDIETLRKEAHSIKGGAGTIEAHPLSTAAKDMEDFCKLEDLEGAVLAFEELKQEFDRLKKFAESHEWAK